MSLKSGSTTFGTSVIRTDEYIMMAKIMVKNGETVHEAAADIKMIDDCMSLMRTRSIIVSHQFTSTGRKRKDATLSSMIEARIDQLCDELKEI